MNVFKIILGVLLSLLLIVMMIYANYGGFSKVSFDVKNEGGETLIYKDIKGSYTQTGDVISKIDSQLKSQYKIVPLRSFGMYFDNPLKVTRRKLRSEAGCILENADTLQVSRLKANFKVKLSPIKNYITTEFPYKGRMSILIGIMKVYPALMKYVKSNGYSETGFIMEIYDMHNNKILYRKEAIKIKNDIL